MADTESLNIKITGDSSQAIREFRKLKEAAEKIANIKMKPILDVMPDWNTQWNFDTSKIKIPPKIGIDFKQQITDAINGLDSAGKKLESTFGSIFKSITRATLAVVGLSGAVGKVVKDSLAIGGGFEAQMTSVKVISGATVEELEKLTAKAREMGATLPITAAQSAEAMTIMAQRGTSVKDILTSVEEVASLAISQSVDLATASDLLGSTLKNFGLAAEETARVSNEFNIASNSSALNISKLVEAMKYVAPSAASVGASLEEALSAMEALANSGLTGEMIGTGLAMVYSKLATNVRVMGVNTKDLDGKMRPLKDIFTELHAKGFGLAEATKEFGMRGAKAALNLVKFSDTLAINEENLKKLGVTQAAVQEKMKSWPNVWNAFKSATEEFHIEIFEQIKTQAKDAVSGIAELTRSFSKWVGETKIAEKSLNAFLEGLGLKIPSINDFKKILDNFNIQDFVERVKNFGASIRNIGESIATFYNSVKIPLGFLIEHLGTFASISFWGWILGKGLQVPAAILGIAGAFKQLHGALKLLTGLNLTGFLTNPIMTSPTTVAMGAIGGMALAGVTLYRAKQKMENHVKEIQEFKDKLAREVDEINKNLVIKVKTDFKTGFEELPPDFYKASSNVRKDVENEISKLQNTFRNGIVEVWNSLEGKEFTSARIEKAIGFSKLEDFTKVMGQNFSKQVERLAEMKKSLNEDLKKIQEDPSNQGLEVEKIVEKAGKGLAEKRKQISELEKSLRDSLNKTIKENFEKISIGDIEVDTIFKKLYAETDKGVKEFSKELLTQITQAVHGSQAALDGLTPDMKKLVEFLKESGFNARTSAEDLEVFINSFRNIEKLKISTKNIVPLSEIKSFNKDIATSINDILKSFPEDIDRMKEYIGGQDFSIFLNVELSQAQKALETFSKTASEKYNIPEDIISAGVFNRLKELGTQGNKIAQSLVNNWKESDTAIDIFMSNAKDAVDYLGASPDKFLPAIEKISKGVQRIDPLTGKVTEQFKKAHNALKEWANTSFDKLTQRLQKLRKAYEGGFIDKNSLEREIKNISPQIKAKVVAELEPMKGQFKSNSDYFGVAASEYISKIQDIFGDIGVEMARNEFANLWSKTGSSMGENIIRQVEKNIQTSFNLESPAQQTFNVQNFAQALNPIASKLEQIANQKQNVSAFDYSASFNIVVNEIKNASVNIQNVRVAIANLENTVKSLQMPVQTKNEIDTTALVNEIKVVSSGIQNLYTAFGNFESVVKSQPASMIDDTRIISSLQEVQKAVLNVENALKSLTGGNTYDIDINQQGFVVQQKSDADNLARSTVSALRAGIGNGGI